VAISTGCNSGFLWLPEAKNYLEIIDVGTALFD